MFSSIYLSIYLYSILSIYLSIYLCIFKEMNIYLLVILILEYIWVAFSSGKIWVAKRKPFKRLESHFDVSYQNCKSDIVSYDINYQLGISHDRSFVSSITNFEFPMTCSLLTCFFIAIANSVIKQ
jgi:ABC-type multidrug transport system permease subunit